MLYLNAYAVLAEICSPRARVRFRTLRGRRVVDAARVFEAQIEGFVDFARDFAV